MILGLMITEGNKRKKATELALPLPPQTLNDLLFNFPMSYKERSAEIKGAGL
jgi:hypothetical protein